MRRTTIAALAAALLSALAPAAAHALPSGTPVPTALSTTDGGIDAIARSGGLTYIGGTFTGLELATGRFARLDPSNGKGAGNPQVTGGDVFATVPDGAGGYFIGGNFTAVGGVQRLRLAHILADGSLDLDFNPGANGSVFAMVLSGTTLYVGGDFTEIAGQPRNRVASLFTGTGNAFSGFDPDVQGGQVQALALSGSRLYAGGDFTQVKGQPRDRIAAIFTGSGNPFSAFDPGANETVSALAVSGNDVYVGGEFAGPDSIGGQERNRIAKLDGTTGSVDLTFNPDSQGPVRTLALDGAELYVGGFFQPVPSVRPGIGGQNLKHLARVSTTTGNADPNWAPQPSSTVFALALDGNSVYAGGGFTTIGAQPRNHLARLSAASGNAFSGFDPNAGDRVFALAVSGSTAGAGGEFDAVNAVARNRIAALDAAGRATDFNPNAIGGGVNALAVSGTDVYVGGSFTNIGGAARNGIAKLFAPTGNAFSGWNPSAEGGAVHALLHAGTDVYVGGAFHGLGGESRKGIAKVSGSTGDTAPGFDPNANDGMDNPRSVFALELSGSTLYAGGDFTEIGGQPRNGIASLFTGSGNAFGGFNPDANDGGTPSSVFALELSGSTLYAGGDFAEIGGQPRNRIAALFTGSGNAFGSFDPDASHVVRTLALSGSTLYAGGDFANIGGEARNGIAALFTGSGNAFSGFNPNTGGGTVRALAATPTGVEAGGYFAEIGGQPRRGYARFDE